jgi:hypothetical protein
MLKGLKYLTRGVRLVPASAADLTTTDTWLYQLSVANKTGGAVTLTVIDQAATPRNVVPVISLPANSVTIMSWPLGIKCTAGLNWVASAADSLEAEVVAGYVAG